jgi:hypothetical protein
MKKGSAYVNLPHFEDFDGRDFQRLVCHHLSELLSNQKRLPLAEVAGYAERS